MQVFYFSRYISTGWELLEKEEKERITFLNIWHGKCPHISVCFRRSTYEQETVSEPCVAIEMSLRLLTFQDELQESAEKIFIQVFEDDITPINDNEIKCDRTHVDDVHIHIHHNYGASGGSDPGFGQRQVVSRSSENSNATDNGDRSVQIVVNSGPSYPSGTESLGTVMSSLPKSLLSHDVRKKLVIMLDPSRSPIGSDWRDFAGALGKDSMICYLQSTSSPTSHLLDIVESNNMQLSELYTIFDNIERKDCAKVVKEYMDGDNQRAESTRDASENSYADNDDTSVKISNRLQSEESSWTDCSYRGNRYNTNSGSRGESMNTFDQTRSKLMNSDSQQTFYKPNIV